MSASSFGPEGGGAAAARDSPDLGGADAEAVAHQWLDHLEEAEDEEQHDGEPLPPPEVEEEEESEDEGLLVYSFPTPKRPPRPTSMSNLQAARPESRAPSAQKHTP